MAKTAIRLTFGADFQDNVMKRRFNLLFEKCLKNLKHARITQADEHGEICVELVDDAKMRLINNRYRKIDKPTDVVSLGYRGEIVFPSNDNLIGEIFISIDTARKQASESLIKVDDELDFLFVHGVLHVFGFDHQNEEEKKVMFDFQKAVLN